MTILLSYASCIYVFHKCTVNPSLYAVTDKFPDLKFYFCGTYPNSLLKNSLIRSFCALSETPKRSRDGVIVPGESKVGIGFKEVEDSKSPHHKGYVPETVI